MIMIQTIKDWALEVKYAYQRVSRGYDDSLFWSLSEYVDPMIRAHVGHLRYSQDVLSGHPYGLTQKKWDKVLDTILKGFVNEPEYTDTKAYKKYRKDRDKALLLLAVYWDNLWDQTKSSIQSCNGTTMTFGNFSNIICFLASKSRGSFSSLTQEIPKVITTLECLFVTVSIKLI